MQTERIESGGAFRVVTLTRNGTRTAGIARWLSIGLSALLFQFEWNEAKAAANLLKHGVSFELASSSFSNPRILTLADTMHRESEERWFSVGLANNGVPMTGGSRRSTASEIRKYTESQ